MAQDKQLQTFATDVGLSLDKVNEIIDKQSFSLEHTSYGYLPQLLKQPVDKIAKQDGHGIGPLITTAAAEKLGALHSAEFFAERRARVDMGHLCKSESAGQVNFLKHQSPAIR